MKLLDRIRRRRPEADLWRGGAIVGAATAVLGATVFGVRKWRKRRASTLASRFAAEHEQDLVDEGSFESFPASDPPSSMSPATSLTGEPRRP